MKSFHGTRYGMSSQETGSTTAKNTAKSRVGKVIRPGASAWQATSGPARHPSLSRWNGGRGAAGSPHTTSPPDVSLRNLPARQMIQPPIKNCTVNTARNAVAHTRYASCQACFRPNNPQAMNTGKSVTTYRDIEINGTG